MFLATSVAYSQTPAKSMFHEGIFERVFGQGQGSESVMRVGLYARVSTHDQQTLPMQLSAMTDYVLRRHWDIVTEVTDVASGATSRPRREELLKAARRRELDVIVVWRLDRWGRSVADLITSLNELQALDVGFVSLTEALDMTTPSGRAMAGMLAVFAEFEREILRDRVKAGIAQARKEGRPHGRPPTVQRWNEEILALHKDGVNASEIARRLKLGRTSVRRVLGQPPVSEGPEGTSGGLGPSFTP